MPQWPPIRVKLCKSVTRHGSADVGANSVKGKIILNTLIVALLVGGMHDAMIRMGEGKIGVVIFWLDQQLQDEQDE